jgi:HEPN domain-containing protein
VARYPLGTVDKEVFLVAGRMVVNGVALANTAIEKYLKALSVHLELPTARTHSTLDLYGVIKASGKSKLALNERFLVVLEKAYALRYPDELPIGFNIALNEMKVLAELDRTVFEIVKSFRFEGVTPGFVANQALLRDERFLAKNVVLNPEEKDSFFNSDSQSFEFRVTETRAYQVDYLSPQVNDDGLFDQPGGMFFEDQSIQAAFLRGEGKETKKRMFLWPDRK